MEKWEGLKSQWGRSQEPGQLVTAEPKRTGMCWLEDEVEPHTPLIFNNTATANT